MTTERVIQKIKYFIIPALGFLFKRYFKTNLLQGEALEADERWRAKEDGFGVDAIGQTAIELSAPYEPIFESSPSEESDKILLD